MKKQVRRKYSDRGQHREYKHLRIDPDTHAKIQRIADTLNLSFLQVVEKMANEAIETLPDQAKEKE